jgi:P4 family phage/plasmid primase-like protien
MTPPDELAARRTRHDADADAKAKAASERAAALRPLCRPANPSNSYLVGHSISPTSTLYEIDRQTACKHLHSRLPSKNGDLTGDVLLVAFLEKLDTISSAQLIDAEGRKHFVAGAPLPGAYWCTEDLAGREWDDLTLIVAEGVAKAIAVAAAMPGAIGVAAGSANNLTPTAKDLRTRFPSARIIIFGDLGNGEKQAREAALAVSGLFALPDLDGSPGAKDANDQIRLKGLSSLAEKLAAATEPEPLAEPEGEPVRVDNSDADHAARLWRELKGACHYVIQWRAFAFYDRDRGVWEQDTGGGKVLAATEKITAQLLDEAKWYAQAASDCADEKLRDKFKERCKFLQEEALQSKGLRFKKSAIELLRAQPGCEVSSEIFDTHHGLLNFLNGVFDLDANEFREHRHTDYLTVVLPYNHDPLAKCALWEKFNAELWPGDLETQRFMQRWDGYCLSGYTSEQVFLYAYGEGQNGKGVRTRIMQLVRGGYATTSPIEMLLAEKHGEKFKGLIDLKGKRHTTCSEVPEGKALNTTLIKLATGEDLMTDAHKYQRNETWTPTHKIEIVGNHLLRLPETGDAIQRRLLMVGYEQCFKGARRDRGLFDKLKSEVPGVMNWCIEGFRQWKQLGEIGAPRKVLDDSAAYIAENDTLGPFFDALPSIVGAGVVDRKILYSTYLTWSRAQGYEFHVGPQAFAGKAREHGLKEGTKRHGERTWVIAGAPGQPGAPIPEIPPREARIGKSSETAAPRCPAAPEPQIDGASGQADPGEGEII